MSASRALAAIVIPLYLARLGYSGLRLGELFLTGALVALVISSSVGLASDRIGRKPFLIFVPFLVTIAGGLFATVTSNWILFAGAAIGGVGRGAGAGAGQVGPYQPAESAYVTDNIISKWRNDAFGRLSFASSFGALLGGLLAILLSPGHISHGQALSDYRPCFITIGVLGTIAGIVAILLSEDKTILQRSRATRSHRIFPRKSLPVLLRLWATNTVNGLAVGMFGPFVTYWLYRRYGVGPGTIGILYSITNVITLGSAVVAAPLARRFHTVKTVTAVRLIQSLLLIPLALSPFFWLAGLIYVVRMFAQRIGMPLRQSYVLAVADPDERSSVAALSNLPAQAAMAGSPVLAGYLFDNISLELPLELGGLLQFINAIMYYFFFKDLRPDEEQEL